MLAYGVDDGCIDHPLNIESTGKGIVAFGEHERVAAVCYTRQRGKGTFDTALDASAVKNVLYGLPSGPILPGSVPPKALTLDRTESPIAKITEEELLAADILVTNYHSLGTGQDSSDILSKLKPDAIDFIVIDEAHIAAAESYQRLFSYFSDAKRLLMSACFQRHDGKPIDADVVYSYRLIDSIADGHAKNLRVRRLNRLRI